MAAIKVLVTSQKGGVGKSTLSANLSAFLAEVGHKSVCLVDFDHQASSSEWVKQVPKPGLSAIFCDALAERDPMVSVLKMKQTIRAAERTHDIVLADLTWVRFFPQSFVLDFDFVLVPTSISQVELSSTMEFVSHFSAMFNSLSQVAPKLVVVPTRMHSTKDYQAIFEQSNFPVRFALSHPISFDLDVQHLFAKQYMYELEHSPVSIGFQKVAQDLQQVFEQKSEVKKRFKDENITSIWESRKALNNRPTVLDKFSLQQRSTRAHISAQHAAMQVHAAEPAATGTLDKIMGLFKKAS
jgi:MinD-like ATPase involved in chromosome partitioning or flagellar assembly